MRKKSDAQAATIAPGVGVSKSGVLYKRSRTLNVPGYMVTETLIMEGEVTMKPEGATVTISGSDIENEFKNFAMNISYSPQNGAESVSFSSKIPGTIENAPSSKVTFRPPFTMIYATDFNVFSLTSNKIKTEGLLRLRLEIETIPIQPLGQLQPVPRPVDPRVPVNPFFLPPEKTKDVVGKGVLIGLASFILSLLLRRPVAL